MGIRRGRGRTSYEGVGVVVVRVVPYASVSSHPHCHPVPSSLSSRRHPRPCRRVVLTIADALSSPSINALSSLSWTRCPRHRGCVVLAVVDASSSSSWTLRRHRHGCRARVVLAVVDASSPSSWTLWTCRPHPRGRVVLDVSYALSSSSWTRRSRPCRGSHVLGVAGGGDGG
jgi:hypothetical protein